MKVLFHPDPRRLILFTGSDDAELRVWDLATRSPLATLDGHFSAVTGLAVSLCGQVLLSAGRDKVVNLWNLQTFKKAGTVPVFEAVEGLAVVPAGAGFPGVGSATLKSKVHSKIKQVKGGFRVFWLPRVVRSFKARLRHDT
jgi:U3 small nucleolar RNA-associated protein 13